MRPPTDVDLARAARTADAFADALEHHARGRLSQAEAGYRSVLQRAPDHPDALHRLGLIAHQVGRDELAIELIGRAIAVNPLQPTYYNDAGIVLQALGRIDEAIARYRQALALAPAYPRAHNGLGIALHDRGRLDEAMASFRTALSLKPDYADAQNNLANLLSEIGRAAEAVEIYRNVLETRDVPGVWCNLARALTDLAAFDDAAQAYAKALVRKETSDAIAGFVESFVAAAHGNADDDVRRAALRALSVPWARPAKLAAACLRVLACSAPIRACIDRAWSAWPTRLNLRELFRNDAAIVFADPLLRLLLESAPVCDLPMERFLTLTRRALLDAASEELDAGGDSALAFASALARQCFVNDYVFFRTDDEVARASQLRDRLVMALARDETPRGFDVAVTASYFPLGTLLQGDLLLSRAWAQPLAALLAQQLREPMHEHADRAAIPRLTPIDDAVSVRVREQYEEHPYPRWVKLPPSGLASPDANRGRFPVALVESARQASLDILVAGCGTGQESIEFAQAFAQARVLAVDLSLSSLAYAERKARELHVANVEHAQADIVKLASLGRRFDVISSVGVLHHLADPERGMRELASMLVPGGHMLIGLYSERGRRDVVAARAFIAECGYRPTPDDIRRCRQALMSADRDRFSSLASRGDFYVTAECRDLLFHVEEHRFTLPQIRHLLDALDLSFAGFLLPPAIAKRNREAPGQDAAIDELDRLEAFEAEFPGAFAGMYIFWVRKGP